MKELKFQDIVDIYLERTVKINLEVVLGKLLKAHIKHKTKHF
jgi:hypothetical protein